MNRIHRVIWSRVRNAWVVTSELAMSGGKSGSTRAITSRPRIQRQHTPMQAAALRIAVLTALFTMQSPSRAADLYWDVNRTGLGLGGTGTWDLTNSFWDTAGDGVSGPYTIWNNATLDNAIFNGTAGTVTLGGLISLHNLTFNVGGYALDAGTLQLAGTAPTITTNAGNTTIDSVIAGTAGLTKAGTAALHLGGTNTFSGGINLNLGSIYASSDAALGASSNNIATAAGAQVRLSIAGAVDTNRTVTIGDGGTLIAEGARVGSARFMGDGSVRVGTGVTMSNDASTYTGTTTFSGCNGVCTTSFTSIADLGQASSLGAPTTVENGTIRFNQSSQYSDNLVYLGTGHSSNRNWSINGAAAVIRNRGSGTLTLTGDIDSNGGTSFVAESADFQLLGVLSGAANLTFNGNAGRSITLGGTNTYSGATAIGATVFAPVLANGGEASSFGVGTSINVNTGGSVYYTGAGVASDREWLLQGATTIGNDGSGALSLDGPLSFTAGGPADSLTLAGNFNGVNTIGGVISGAGSIVSNGSGTWVLEGANTYDGSVTVQSGTLRAGNANAFGLTREVTINGGTLDLNGYDWEIQSLAGSGGVLALGDATLTLNAASGSTLYGGSITGSGGLIKLGTSTQTLSGANTYTGDTAIGGGTLALDFSAAGGPTDNIISSASSLQMSGGNLVVTGAAGETNVQTFDGVHITGGSNNISAVSGAGGSVTIDLGAITRSGGLVDFDLPTAGAITTSTTSLGGWATVNNGTDYAKVVGGTITALSDSDYRVEDQAGNWQDGDIITDDLGFQGTVTSSVQLGGLRYTAPTSTIVTIDGGQTLGIDGNILVAPSVGTNNNEITGGSLTGAVGGGMLGVQQNSDGLFRIESQIVDNGADQIGFTKAGTGEVVLANASNSYSGPTVISQGTLTVSSIANGGQASSIGASSADSANLVIEAGTLRYEGGTVTTDRGFTIVRGGATPSTINVTSAASNLTFTGVVTSVESADFTKTGAGTLTLANGANDYLGVTHISGGTLSVTTLADGGEVSSIGRSSSDAGNLLLENGATLQYTGGSVSIDRGFTVVGGGGGGGAVEVSDVDTTLTFSGSVVGTGGFFKDGAGTLVLAGNNTQSGQMIVREGTLRAGSTQAFGAPARMSLVGGTTLDLAGFNNTVSALSDWAGPGGNVTLGSATLTLHDGTSSFSGAISGTGGLTKTGGGTQTLVGCNNTYEGVTTISSGTLRVDCLADGGVASGIGAASNDPSSLVLNGGTLSYAGGSVGIDRGMTLQSGSSTIEVTQAATQLEIEGLITGSGALVKSGSGTLVLSNTNDYSGNTTISNGILRAGTTNAFGTGGLSLGNAADAVLDLNDFNTTAAFLTGGGAAGGTVDLGTATLTLNASSGNRAFGGTIVGTGGLIKTGNAVQQLAGCGSSYTGTTVINGGRLDVACLSDGNSNSSIGASGSAASNLVINNNAALRYVGDGDSTDRQFTMGGHATLYADGTGAMEFTSTAPIALTGTTARTLTLRGSNQNDNTLAAQITNSAVGATSLTKLDGGTWILTNLDNTYTGVTTISGGVLGVSKLADGGEQSSIGTSSAAASNLVIGNNSTLRYTGSGDSTNRLFTLAQGVTYIESSGTGAIELTNTGSATLQGSGSRTLALGGTNADLNIMGGTIADASATGRTALAKNDSGTWVLTGNNTYTGNTVINAGNLMIGNGGTTGNAGAGNVIVDAPGSTLSFNRSDTFDFNGSLSGPGTVAQIGSGTTRLTATDNDIGATVVDAGTLEIDGSLTSDTIAMNGTGTLNVNGIVQGDGAGVATFTGDAGASTIDVNGGGTLRAIGDLDGGSDSVNLAGTLDTGAGVLSLGAGDDSFTLKDGAVITGGGIDAGSAATADVLILDNAAAFTFNGGTTAGFESLVKQNSGVATMTGTQTFTTGTTVSAGTLDVDGTLLTGAVAVIDGSTLNVDGTVQAATAALDDGSTLNINGTMQAAGATQTAITGSSGVNTVVVNAGAHLLATGDLGDGNDVLDVAGTLDTGGGVFSLGDGNDTLVVHDTTVVIGTLDAGAGDDVLNVNVSSGSVVPLGSTTGFESLGKSGLGRLAINGASDFVEVQVQAGALDVTATGSIEAQSATVSAGATLNVDGAFQFTTGADEFIVAGNVTGSGAIDMRDGDDVLIIQDGATIDIAIDAGTAVTGDTLVLDSAAALTFDGTNVTGFEEMVKQNAGIASLSGTHTYGSATIDEGTLDVDGTLNTASVVLSDDTIFSIDGVAQAAGATQTAITGDAGVNTVVINAGGTLRATGDLGAGDDVLDISGTLDTGAGTLSLGDGDDSFVIHDGTTVIGNVEGGAGLDTRVYNINLTATVGSLTGFEGLEKTGTGVLNLTGPGTSIFEEVSALGGTLNVEASGSIADVQTTNVAAGAILNVDGAYSGSAGDDTFTVAGTVSGAGTIDLGTGEDLLVIQDGASIDARIDGGAGSDTVLLDSASALSFAGTGVAGFEQLAKQNDGTATLLGTHAYSTTTIDGGTLDVDGVLETGAVAVNGGTTLNVDGTVQAGAATQTAITGSTGVETVIVGTGGTLLATGDLGDGADVLDVAGTLDTGGGTLTLGGGTLTLGAGDDTFVIHDGAVVTGTVSGGAGMDTRVYDIAGTASVGALQEFEGLTKRNTGTLTITGPALTTGLIDIAVEGGVLGVAASATVTGVQTVTVDSGATLDVDGNVDFTAGGDSFTVAGNVTGMGSIDMLDGDDHLTLLDGADLSGLTSAINGGAGVDTLTIDIATTARLGGATGFETLIKDGVGTATITGPADSALDTVLVREGMLEVAAGALVDPQTTVIDAGATMLVDGTYNGTTGADVFTLSGTLAGGGTVDLLGGDDVLTINTGSDVTFSALFDAGTGGADEFVLAGAGDDTFDASLIDTVFQNFDEFRKEGAGTWRLAGNAARDWTVAEGTLIGDSNSLGGDIDNAAIVVFDQAFEGSYDGVLSGGGTLIKQNTGTLAMSAANTFSGDVEVQAGALQVDGTLPATILVASTGTLSGVGTVGLVTTQAGGVVAPGNAANQFGTLTIAGNYDGVGTVRISTELGDETSATSRLVIRGNATGSSAVLVDRAGGNGDATAGDGIHIIQVDGVSAVDSFRLGQPVQAGAYEYLLHQGGAADANDWYLRSELIDPNAPVDPTPAFRPGVAGYLLGQQANLEYGFSALGNLRDRVGDQGRMSNAERSEHTADAWMRVYAHEIDIGGKRFEAQNLQMTTVHFGTDVYSAGSGDATTHVGLMASVGESTATFFDTARGSAGLGGVTGDVESDVQGAGIYWTRHGAKGGYFDLSAQFLHYRNRYHDQYRAVSHQSGWGGTMSAEIGSAFRIGATGWKIEPQLQLAYQRLELDDFEDQVSTISAVNEDALRARVALQVFRTPGQWLGMTDASPYFAVGAQRDFMDADSITVGTTRIAEEIPDTTGDVSVGFTGSVRPGIELHLDLQYQHSTEGERDGVRGNFGFRMSF